MKSTMKILGMLLMSLVLVTSCSKDDPKPNPDPEGGNTIENTFDISNILFKAVYMDFVGDNEGYLIGQTKEQYSNFTNITYTVLKTTGDNKWEVINSNLLNLRFAPFNPFIVEGGKAYGTHSDDAPNYPAITLRSVDLQTGQTIDVVYDESLNSLNPPSIDQLKFFTPATQNGNIVAGLATVKDLSDKKLYVYLIDITTDKIVKMTEVEVIDEYQKFDAFNNYIGYNFDPYRCSVHLFSDNSFIVGPIAHPENFNGNLDYIFMTYYEGTGWSDNALKINAHDGVDVMYHYMAGMGLGNQYGTGIFGDKSGDVLYYLEHNANEGETIAENSIYKITDKGDAITKLSLTEAQMNSRFIMLGDTEKGCIVSNNRNDWGELWFTNDGGNSWDSNNELGAYFFVDGSGMTSNYYYFVSETEAKIVRIKK